MSTSLPPPGFTDPTPAPPIEEAQPAPWENPPKRPRGRAKLLVGGLAVVVLAAAGFFFLGSKGTQLNNDPIAQAATLSSNVAGYRMRMSMEMTSSALNSPITATGRGVVDVRDHATSMSLAMNLGDEPGVVQALGSGTFRMQMITDGTDVYLKLPSALTGNDADVGQEVGQDRSEQVVRHPGALVAGEQPDNERSQRRVAGPALGVRQRRRRGEPAR